MTQFPPQPVGEGPVRSSSGVKPFIIAALILVGVLAISCAGLAVLAFLGFSEAMKPPENINLAIDAPATVATGSTFTVTVSIENTATETQKLDSIDIFDDYLAGLAIQTSQPAWSESMRILNFTSYDYGLDIDPGATLTVQYTMQALTPGDYAGDIDVCINNELSCLTQAVRTVVADEPTSP